MELPPLFKGASHVRFVTVFKDDVPLTVVGDAGVVLGVILVQFVLYALDPAAFIAATLKIYPVPFVSPTIVDCVSVEAV